MSNFSIKKVADRKTQRNPIPENLLGASPKIVGNGAAITFQIKTDGPHRNILRK